MSSDGFWEKVLSTIVKAYVTISILAITYLLPKLYEEKKRIIAREREAELYYQRSIHRLCYSFRGHP